MKWGFLPARKPGLSYGWKHPLVLAGAVVDGITETRHLTLPKLETATMTVVEVTVTRHLKLLDIQLPDLTWGFDNVLQLYDGCRYQLLIRTTVIL